MTCQLNWIICKHYEDIFTHSRCILFLKTWKLDLFLSSSSYPCVLSLQLSCFTLPLSHFLPPHRQNLQSHTPAISWQSSRHCSDTLRHPRTTRARVIYLGLNLTSVFKGGKKSMPQNGWNVVCQNILCTLRYIHTYNFMAGLSLHVSILAKPPINLQKNKINPCFVLQYNPVLFYSNSDCMPPIAKYQCIYHHHHHHHLLLWLV